MKPYRSNLLALVRDAGGVTKGQGVVVGADPSALQALGEIWRVAQGGQEGYHDYSVEGVDFYDGVGHGSYFTLVAAMRQGRVTLQEAAARLEMLAFMDGRLQAHDLAQRVVEALAMDTPAGRVSGVYDRALEIVAGVLHQAGNPTRVAKDPIDAQALAEGAVDAMGDVFWDADSYSSETLYCPECEAEIRVGLVSCPQCKAEFGEPLSKEAAIRQDAVDCVARAIERALQQSSPVQMELHALQSDELLRKHQCDFTVRAGGRKLIDVHVKPRKHSPQARRTPRHKAAAVYILGPDGWAERWCVSLGETATYLRRLGLDSTLLYERAREKGWEVGDE
jgi:hypothetical protein